MAAVRVILTLASLALPASHRARWREEALSILLAVRGARRWVFLLDTVVKAPLLAREYRRPGGPWPVLAGAMLLGMPVLLVASLLLAPVVGEGAAELLFLLTPCGMAGLVAVRSFRGAAARGGGVLRHGAALVVTLFAGFGPVAGGVLSVVTGTPLLAVVSAAVPGVWLATVSVSALARRTSPASLAVLGLASGAGLAGVLTGVQLVTHVPAMRAAASLLTVLSLALLVPAYPVWSGWTGVRLLRRDATG